MNPRGNYVLAKEIRMKPNKLVRIRSQHSNNMKEIVRIRTVLASALTHAVLFTRQWACCHRMQLLVFPLV